MTKKYTQRYMLTLILGVFLTSTVIFILPKNKKLAYDSLQQDYVKGGWIYHRVFEDERAIDIAFVGTSHTEGNVNDALIESGIYDYTGKLVHVANLAIPQHGRNMHYVITKDTFNKKKPALLVLEVKAYESRKSHHLFSRLADVTDVVTPSATFNLFAFRDLLSAMRWQIAQYLTPVTQLDSDYAEFGFRNNDPEAHLDISELKKLVEKRKLLVDESYFGGKLDFVEYSLPRSYIQKILSLSRNNDSKLVFLYLPYFGASPLPRDYEYYEQFGDVWIPPPEIFGDPKYWKDAGHLNTEGALALVPWLINKSLNELQQ